MRSWKFYIVLVFVLAIACPGVHAGSFDKVGKNEIEEQVRFNVFDQNGERVSGAKIVILDRDNGRLVEKLSFDDRGQIIVDFQKEKVLAQLRGPQLAARSGLSYEGITDVNYIAIVTTQHGFGVYNFPKFYVNDIVYAQANGLSLSKLSSEIKELKSVEEDVIDIHLSPRNDNEIVKSSVMPMFFDLGPIPVKYKEEWIGSKCVWLDNVFNIRSGRVGVEYTYEAGRKHKIEVGINKSNKWVSGAGYVSVTNARSVASKWGMLSNRIGTSAGFKAGSNYSFYKEYWMIPGAPFYQPTYFEQVVAKGYDGGTFRSYFSYCSMMEKPYGEVKNGKHGKWSPWFAGDTAEFKAEGGFEMAGAVTIYGVNLKSISVKHNKSAHYYYPYGDGTPTWCFYCYDGFSSPKWSDIYCTEGRK